MTPVGAAERGASLVELLVSLLFVSILSAMSYGFARAALRSAWVQEVKSEAQEVTVMALEILARDVRSAGFNAAGPPIVPAIRAATRGSLEVLADLNGDGDTSDSNERIAYAYDGNKRQLMRATGGGWPQPVVQNVPSEGFTLSYFDAQGTELPAGGANMSEDQRRLIRRIDVALQVEIANPDPRVTAPLTSVVSSSICLRNP